MKLNRITAFYISRGHQQISEEDIHRLYRGTHIGNDQIIPTRDNNVRMFQLSFKSISMPQIITYFHGVFKFKALVSYTLPIGN
jgi:hypothetical protein